jgi:hypothetical protein
MFWFDVEGQVQYVGTLKHKVHFYFLNGTTMMHMDMLVSLWFVNEKQACVYEHRVEGYLLASQTKLMRKKQELLIHLHMDKSILRYWHQ